MAEFLSRAWLADLDAAARASGHLSALARDPALVIEQQVHGSPGGDVVYQVIVDLDGGRVEHGSGSPADVVLITDYDTAAAIHRGEINAQHAFAAGRFKVLGEIRELLERADALRAVDDVFAIVRDRTATVAPGADDRR